MTTSKDKNTSQANKRYSMSSLIQTKSSKALNITQAAFSETTPV